jgi:hypothetical protein
LAIFSKTFFSPRIYTKKTPKFPKSLKTLSAQVAKIHQKKIKITDVNPSFFPSEKPK